MTTLTHAGVAAAIRSVLGAHTQAQDAGDVNALVELYAPDAVLVVPGQPDISGIDAIREAFVGWAPTAPQKHLVANTVITVDTTIQAVSDVVFFQRTDAGWAPLVVGRYVDTFTESDGAWRISRRETTYQS
ncbi:MAG: nuclear transport factor 2 family protein [Gordonia sp. (in: high G+C Gram-positive bacteria)]